MTVCGGRRRPLGLVLGFALFAMLSTSACDVASMEFAGLLGGRPEFNLEMIENGNGTVDLDASDAEKPENYRWAELWRIAGESPYGMFEVWEVTEFWPPRFDNQPTGYCYRVGIVWETEPDKDGGTSHIFDLSTPVIAR